MASLILARLAYEGHSVLPAVIPLCAGALSLIALAALARPAPVTRRGVFGQLLGLGLLAPICGLAVVAQYHYSAVVFSSGHEFSEAWSVTLEQLANLFSVRHMPDRGLLLSASTSAALATYVSAPGRRFVRALWAIPLPSVAILGVAVAFHDRARAKALTAQGLSHDGGLLTFALGLFAFAIAWSLVFLLAERFGPDLDSTSSKEAVSEEESSPPPAD